MSASTLDPFHAAFKTLARTLPGAELGWLRSARRHALDQFEALGFPTTQLEDWKYTNVATVAQRPWHFTSPRGDDVDVASIVNDLVLDKAAGRLVFVNGRHIPRYSRLPDLPEGTFVGSLTRAMREIPQRLEAVIAQHAPHDAFAALNTAFMSDGYVVVLPRGAHIEAPLQMLFITDEAGLAMHAFNAVFADAGARCSIVEQFVGVADDAYLANTVTKIVAAAEADIQHCRLQQEATHRVSLLTRRRRAAAGEPLYVALVCVWRRAFAHADRHAPFGRGRACGIERALLRGRAAACGSSHACRSREAARHESRVLPRRAGWRLARRVQRARGRASRRAADRHASGESQSAALTRCADRHQAATGNSRRRREVHARCDRGSTRRESALLSACTRHRRTYGARIADLAFARDSVDRVGMESVRARLTRLLLARMPEGERIREMV